MTTEESAPTAPAVMSRLGLGCWPLSGMTRHGITRDDAVATVAAAIDAGINHLDTAYCYGEQGESERAICSAMKGRRRETVFLASKCGIHWEAGRQQTVDGSPQRLVREAEESLRRLGTDHLDLLYLHAPDPAIPVEESASALAELLDAGKTRSVGCSNVTLEQLQLFASVCPTSACQMPYNMLQRSLEERFLPWCQAQSIGLVSYWPLMKGLLTGTMERDRQFPTSDSRHKYPMFQGKEFQRNLDFVEALRPIAARLETTIPAIVLAWTMCRAGISSVLFGATTPSQVAENTPGLTCQLDEAAFIAIDDAYQARGPVASRRAVR